MGVACFECCRLHLLHSQSPPLLKFSSASFRRGLKTELPSYRKKLLRKRCELLQTSKPMCTLPLDKAQKIAGSVLTST